MLDSHSPPSFGLLTVIRIWGDGKLAGPLRWFSEMRLPGGERIGIGLPHGGEFTLGRFLHQQIAQCVFGPCWSIRERGVYEDMSSVVVDSRVCQGVEFVRCQGTDEQRSYRHLCRLVCFRVFVFSRPRLCRFEALYLNGAFRTGTMLIFPVSVTVQASFFARVDVCYGSPSGRLSSLLHRQGGLIGLAYSSCCSSASGTLRQLIQKRTWAELEQ